jgi:small subunit ribosomal protein S1
LEEILDFKVIEFNKDAKKIVLSHTRMFEEGEDKPTMTKSGKKSAGGSGSGSGGNGNSTDQAVKAINQNTEKSTLGDLGGLAELKQKMEKGE